MELCAPAGLRCTSSQLHLCEVPPVVCRSKADWQAVRCHSRCRLCYAFCQHSKAGLLSQTTGAASHR